MFASHAGEQIVTGRLAGCLLEIRYGEGGQAVCINTADREKQVKGILNVALGRNRLHREAGCSVMILNNCGCFDLQLTLL